MFNLFFKKIYFNDLKIKCYVIKRNSNEKCSYIFSSILMFNFHITIYFNIFFIIESRHKNIKLFRLNFIFKFLFNTIYNSLNLKNFVFK